MKKIFSWLKDFVKEDFHPYFYTYTFLFLILTISLNYVLDFEDSVIDAYKGTNWHSLFYFLFYACAYYGIAIPQSIFLKAGFHRSYTFWTKSLLFIIILAIDGGFHFHGAWIQHFQNRSSAEYLYLYGLANNIYPAIIYFPILFCSKALYSEPADEGLYGLSFNRFDPLPYLLFLIFMMPLIFIASFQEGFLESYPEARNYFRQDVFGWEPWKSVLLFETCYLLDFTWVELLFRGAMVVGLSSVMGRHVLLPMVVTYAFLHFGKPAAETMGSVFGGYLLGVIAFRSRNILGGIAIHMGIAFLMELFAFLQYYFRR